MKLSQKNNQITSKGITASDPVLLWATTKLREVFFNVAADFLYADIVRTARQNSELNLVKMGAQVTGMRRTRDEHFLIELAKSAESVETAQKLSSAIATRLEDAVGAVLQLEQYSVVEIVDLDVVATESESSLHCGQQCLELTTIKLSFTVGRLSRSLDYDLLGLARKL